MNKLAKEYKNKVDFVILFWDTDIFTEDYSKEIFLVPSKKMLKEANKITISGFKHSLGFPYLYMVNSDKKIVDTKIGAIVPNKKNTKEEALERNYKSLKVIIDRALN